MAGGLIQIASYGIHDVFLIGNPQITFFKTVYRKHTNFSMEYLEENFNGQQNFGNYLTCNLSKAGDLLHKLYIKIVIPQVAINKSLYANSEINKIDPYTSLNISYTEIQKFINITNFNLIQPLYQLLNVNNLNYNEINSKYQILLNRINYAKKLNDIVNIKISFDKTFALPLVNSMGSVIYLNVPINVSKFIDFNSYYSSYIKPSSTSVTTDLKFLLDNFVLQLQIIKSNIYDQLLFAKKLSTTLNRTNINFAWVDNLGHQILNRVEIEIGGKVIDFTDSVRANIHHQLTNKILQDFTYDKLIGNVNELKTYNSVTKPSYILYIPLEFWFNKYSGLSLPMIYLRYHDVKINLQLNDLVNCCYYEQLNSTTMIEELIMLDSVSLIVNYIYLDSDERQKFAQLSHEYLIDQTQIGSYSNITSNSFNTELPFFNPVKQLFWVCRDSNNIARLKYFEYSASYYSDIYEFMNSYDNLNPNIASNHNLIKIRSTDNNIGQFIYVGDLIYIENSIYYSGIYKVIAVESEYVYIEFQIFMKESYSYNYNVVNYNGTTTYTKSSSYAGNSQAWIKKITNTNPINYSTLVLNGVQRIDKVDGIYTNFVQPYQHNNKSPAFGLNTYSFALNPDEYQPSGFCNFNPLDLKTMTLVFNSSYINSSNSNGQIAIPKSLNIIFYAHSYNVLRLAFGKAGIILNI